MSAAELLALADVCASIDPAEAERVELGVQVNEALGIASYITDDGDPTQSVDGAIAIVPEGWYWRCGHGTLWPGWAHLNRIHPDFCDRDDEHSANAATPALALTAAALRAHATLSNRFGAGAGR